MIPGALTLAPRRTTSNWEQLTRVVSLNEEVGFPADRRKFVFCEENVAMTMLTGSTIDTPRSDPR